MVVIFAPAAAAAGIEQDRVADAIHQNGACAALTFAAAILCSGEIQAVAQNGEQGFFCRSVYRIRFAIDVQNQFAHCKLPTAPEGPAPG